MNDGVFIHDTAEVSELAILGNNTKIWNLVQIRENTVLGENCIVSKNVYIDFDVKIGNNVKVQNNVSVYNGVTIEDDVFVGPCVVFTNDFRPRAVAPNWKVTPTLVEKGASLGANCTLVCGITVGQYAMVAAGSVVTKSIAPHTLVAGNPAKVIAFIYKSGAKVLVSDIVSVDGSNVRFCSPEDGEELLLPASSIRLLPKV